MWYIWQKFLLPNWWTEPKFPSISYPLRRYEEGHFVAVRIKYILIVVFLNWGIRTAALNFNDFSDFPNPPGNIGCGPEECLPNVGNFCTPLEGVTLLRRN